MGRFREERLKLAVFDVDGTLIDSEHNIVSAMTEAWSRMGLGVPNPAQVRRIIGLSLVEACAQLLPAESEATHRAVAEHYKDAFRMLRQVPDSVEPLFPGVVDALDDLKEQGWLLGIATGKSRRGVDAVLSSHDLDGRFITIQTADDNPGKPNPDMLLHAAAQSGVEMRDVVMIGDTSYDMQMAVAAHAAPVGVNWGYHSVEELRRAGAMMVIDSFIGLNSMLLTVTGGRR